MPEDAQNKPGPEAPISERTLARIRSFRLIDDLFMRVCFAHGFACAQTVLRIVLKRPKLTVVSVQVQSTVQALPGRRSLTPDVLIRDSEGGLHDLEMQRKKADPERFRLHAAMLDAAELEAGADFADLPELNVIFILEHDPCKQGLPLYEFVRYMPEIGLPLNDGARILLVNGEMGGRETELARLVHDIFCADPDEMLIEELAAVVRYFKQTDEGVREMSSVVEEIREEGRIEGWEAGRVEGWEEGRIEGREEGREEGRIEGREEGLAKGRIEEKTEIALQMLRMARFKLEDIAEITRLSVNEVRTLAAAHAPEALKNADRAEGERAEKDATIRQLMKMGGFTPESIAEITRLDVDEVRRIIARRTE